MPHPKVVTLTYRTLLKDCRQITKFFQNKETSDIKSVTFSEFFPQRLRLSLPLRHVESLFTSNNFAEIVKHSYRNYYRPRTKEERFDEYIKRKQDRESFAERNGLDFEDINTHFKLNLQKILEDYRIQNPELVPTLSTLFDLYLRQEELQDMNAERLEHIDHYLLQPNEEREKIDQERLDFAFAALRANSEILTFLSKYISDTKPKLDLGTIIKHKTEGYNGVICKSYDFLPTMDSTKENVAQNHYLCLVSPKSKAGFCYVMGVAEEEIEPVAEHVKVYHSHFDRLFTGFDESTMKYIPAKSLIETQKKIEDGKDYFLPEHREDY